MPLLETTENASLLTHGYLSKCSDENEVHFSDGSLINYNLGYELPFTNGRIDPWGRDRTYDRRYTHIDGDYSDQYGAVEDTGWLSPGDIAYPQSVVGTVEPVQDSTGLKKGITLFNTTASSVYDDNATIFHKTPGDYYRSGTQYDSVNKLMLHAYNYGAILPDDAIVTGVEVRTRRLQQHEYWSSGKTGNSTNVGGFTGNVQLVAGDLAIDTVDAPSYSTTVRNLYESDLLPDSGVADTPMYRMNLDDDEGVAGMRSFDWGSYYEWNGSSYSTQTVGAVPPVTTGNNGVEATMKDTWGIDLTREVVGDNTFGVLFYIYPHSSMTSSNYIYTGPNSFLIDSIQVKVHYVRKGQKVYFADSTTNTPVARGDLISTFKEDGDWLTGGNPFATIVEPGGEEYLRPIPENGGDAEGLFTVRNLDKITWTDEDNYTVEDYEGLYENPLRDICTGNIKAYTSLYGCVQDKGRIADIEDSGYPITLPGSSLSDDVHGAGTRYQSIIHNFYSHEQFEAVYTVTGVSPSFTYDFDEDQDEFYFHYNYTGLEGTVEKPRHVAYAGQSLALGYSSGTVLISSVGQPDTFDTTGTAQVWEFGDRITGLLPMKGGVLGAFTDNNIRGLYYNDLDVKVLSPNSGAIEYTVQDVGGIPVFCDSRGISSLDASDKFGDFQLGRLSAKVSRLTTDKLQKSVKGLSNISTTCVVRNKNQYRLFFRDGDIMTATIAPNNSVEVTTQSYGNNLYVRDMNSLETDIGQEKIFGTMDYIDYTSVTVDDAVFSIPFQYDVGYSFSGDPIDHWIELNPIHNDNPIQQNQYQLVDVHMYSQGGAALSMFTGGDYLSPTDTEILPPNPNTAGEDIFSVDRQYSVKRYTIKRTGTNITIKLQDESITPDHTLQALVIYFDRGAVETAYTQKLR